MKCYKVDIKTGKAIIVDVDQKTLDSIALAMQYAKNYKTTIANINASAKTKLISLGFTEDECKHIIH